MQRLLATACSGCRSLALTAPRHASPRGSALALPRRLLSTAEQPPKASNLRGPVSWATLGLTVAAGTGAVVYYNVAKARKQADASTRVETYGQALLGGPWSLVDSDGRPVTSGDFAGKYVLLYFGFTFCPDICPSELVKIAKVVDALDKSPEHAGKVVPVFVSLDPYRDTCAQVGAYCADFHPRMVGLTGTPGQVAKAAKAFRVYFSEVDRKEGDEDEDYLVDHSIVTYLLGPDGGFMEFFTQLMTAPEIAAKLDKVLKADYAKRGEAEGGKGGRPFLGLEIFKGLGK